MYIAVDFDGTCVTHDFPKVGVTLPNCVEVLKELVAEGHELILYTMRSGSAIGPLQDAINWFKEHGIELYAINENPSQINWTSSRKVFAQKYIDDAAIGCPLIYNVDGEFYEDDMPIHDRPYVDWVEIRYELELAGILKEKIAE